MKTVASFLSPSPASFRALPVSMPGRVDTRVPPTGGIVLTLLCVPATWGPQGTWHREAHRACP